MAWRVNDVGSGYGATAFAGVQIYLLSNEGDEDAEGRLYLHGENGDLALVAVSPEGPREVGRFSPPDPPDRGRAKAWSYPAIADGRLYLRDAGSLWCYAIGAN